MNSLESHLTTEIERKLLTNLKENIYDDVGLDSTAHFVNKFDHNEEINFEDFIFPTQSLQSKPQERHKIIDKRLESGLVNNKRLPEIIKKNNSSCHTRNIMTSCQCFLGHQGPRCSLKIDPCQRKSCLDSVERSFYCKATRDSYNCICLSILGDLMQFEEDETKFGTGEIKGRRDVNCHCSFGFYGRNCQHRSTKCLINHCQNGGTCIDILTRTFCICPPGTLGVNCEKSLNQQTCRREPCFYGGRFCRAHHNSTHEKYVCRCSSERGRSCRDLRSSNACSRRPCIDNALCIPTKGGDDYYCLCPPELKDNSCDRIIPLMNPPMKPVMVPQSSLITNLLSDESIAVITAMNKFVIKNIVQDVLQPYELNAKYDVKPEFPAAHNHLQADQISQPSFQQVQQKPTQSPEIFIKAGEYKSAAEYGLIRCVHSPCANGGTCYVQDREKASFVCKCMPGYTGKLCTSEEHVLATPIEEESFNNIFWKALCIGILIVLILCYILILSLYVSQRACFSRTKYKEELVILPKNTLMHSCLDSTPKPQLQSSSERMERSDSSSPLISRDSVFRKSPQMMEHLSTRLSSEVIPKPTSMKELRRRTATDKSQSLPPSQFEVTDHSLGSSIFNNLNTPFDRRSIKESMPTNINVTCKCVPSDMSISSKNETTPRRLRHETDETSTFKDKGTVTFAPNATMIELSHGQKASTIFDASKLSSVARKGQKATPPISDQIDLNRSREMQHLHENIAELRRKVDDTEHLYEHLLNSTQQRASSPQQTLQRSPKSSPHVSNRFDQRAIQTSQKPSSDSLDDQSWSAEMQHLHENITDLRRKVDDTEHLYEHLLNDDQQQGSSPRQPNFDITQTPRIIQRNPMSSPNVSNKFDQRFVRTGQKPSSDSFNETDQSKSIKIQGLYENIADLNRKVDDMESLYDHILNYTQQQASPPQTDAFDDSQTQRIIQRSPKSSPHVLNRFDQMRTSQISSYDSFDDTFQSWSPEIQHLYENIGDLRREIDYAQEFYENIFFYPPHPKILNDSQNLCTTQRCSNSPLHTSSGSYQNIKCPRPKSSPDALNQTHQRWSRDINYLFENISDLRGRINNIQDLVEGLINYDQQKKSNLNNKCMFPSTIAYLNDFQQRSGGARRTICTAKCTDPKSITDQKHTPDKQRTAGNPHIYENTVQNKLPCNMLGASPHNASLKNMNGCIPCRKRNGARLSQESIHKTPIHIGSNPSYKKHAVCKTCGKTIHSTNDERNCLECAHEEPSLFMKFVDPLKPCPAIENTQFPEASKTCKTINKDSDQPYCDCQCDKISYSNSPSNPSRSPFYTTSLPSVGKKDHCCHKEKVSLPCVQWQPPCNFPPCHGVSKQNTDANPFRSQNIVLPDYQRNNPSMTRKNNCHANIQHPQTSAREKCYFVPGQGTHCIVPVHCSQEKLMSQQNARHNEHSSNAETCKDDPNLPQFKNDMENKNSRKLDSLEREDLIKRSKEIIILDKNEIKEKHKDDIENDIKEIIQGGSKKDMKEAIEIDIEKEIKLDLIKENSDKDSPENKNTSSLFIGRTKSLNEESSYNFIDLKEFNSNCVRSEISSSQNESMFDKYERSLPSNSSDDIHLNHAKINSLLKQRHMVSIEDLTDKSGTFSAVRRKFSNDNSRIVTNVLKEVDYKSDSFDSPPTKEFNNVNNMSKMNAKNPKKCSRSASSDPQCKGNSNKNHSDLSSDKMQKKKSWCEEIMMKYFHNYTPEELHLLLNQLASIDPNLVTSVMEGYPENAAAVLNLISRKTSSLQRSPNSFSDNSSLKSNDDSEIVKLFRDSNGSPKIVEDGAKQFGTKYARSKSSDFKQCMEKMNAEQNNQSNNAIHNSKRNKSSPIASEGLVSNVKRNREIENDFAGTISSNVTSSIHPLPFMDGNCKIREICKIKSLEFLANDLETEQSKEACRSNAHDCKSDKLEKKTSPWDKFSIFSSKAKSITAEEEIPLMGSRDIDKMMARIRSYKDL